LRAKSAVLAIMADLGQMLATSDWVRELGRRFGWGWARNWESQCLVGGRQPIGNQAGRGSNLGRPGETVGDIGLGQGWGLLVAVTGGLLRAPMMLAMFEED